MIEYGKHRKSKVQKELDKITEAEASDKEGESDDEEANWSTGDMYEFLKPLLCSLTFNLVLHKEYFVSCEKFVQLSSFLFPSNFSCLAPAIFCFDLTVNQLVKKEHFRYDMLLAVGNVFVVY